MTLLIALLTFVLVLNSILLILLVLIQLPKKEAGAGIAFGGGATDALFGAGSGNALTKMTKYAATTFLALSLSLSLMNSSRARQPTRGLEQELLKKAGSPSGAMTPPPAAPALENKTGAAGTATTEVSTPAVAPKTDEPAPAAPPTK